MKREGRASATTDKALWLQKKKVCRWFYIDIRKALDGRIDREDAIVRVPEGKIERTDFGREVTRDLSTPAKEYAALMYPVSQVFDWDKWQDGLDKHWAGDEHKAVREDFRTFKRNILENFKYYHVPVIALDRSTSKEAVCVVFEKVNTGGKALDASELVTAIYAASGHELRKDWYGDDNTKGRHRRLADAPRHSRYPFEHLCVSRVLQPMRRIFTFALLQTAGMSGIP